MSGTMRMTFSSALRAELLKLPRSPLVVAHAACALAAGFACGAYFSATPWDPSFGTDAYVQFLGALMPLMAGIACGLAVDEERRAGRLANLLAAPSRQAAVLAKLAVLWIAASLTLIAAISLFSCILALADRFMLPLSSLALSAGGLALGSLPLYALSLALSLCFGRNASIAVGAAGMLVAFFSVGGLAHGLMTGSLTGAMPSGALGAIPFCWAARLGSLGVESAIASTVGCVGAVIDAASWLVPACTTLCALASAVLTAWFVRFEEGRSNA